MFKFIHAADIHLDSPLRGLERYEDAPVDEIRSATRRAFDNLVDYAIAEDAAFLLLAGDIYDGDWTDYNTGLFFVSRMNRLRDAGISVHLVSGNHDAASRITKALRLPANVTLYDHRKPQTHVIEELDVAIHGQSFSNRAVTDDLAAAYPSALSNHLNIGLLHTSLGGYEQHASYAPTTPAMLHSKGYDYWALGHVHAFEEVSTDPWIVFPGNIQGRHIRETGPKGAVLVTVEDGAITDVAPFAVDVLRWAQPTVDASGLESGDAFLDSIEQLLASEVQKADGRPVALRITIEGRCPAHEELLGDQARWMQECRALASAGPGIWIESLRFKTTSAQSVEIDGDDALAGDALAGLAQTLTALDQAPDDLQKLGAVFQDLKTKLPSEFTSGVDGLDPTDPETLRGALSDVRELLFHRLLHGPGST